jgi:hypothetical protein
MHSRPVLLRILISSSMRYPGVHVSMPGAIMRVGAYERLKTCLEIISTLSYLSLFFKLFLYIRRLLYQEFILASVR